MWLAVTRFRHLQPVVTSDFANATRRAEKDTRALQSRQSWSFRALQKDGWHHAVARLTDPGRMQRVDEKRARLADGRLQPSNPGRCCIGVHCEMNAFSSARSAKALSSAHASGQKIHVFFQVRFQGHITHYIYSRSLSKPCFIARNSPHSLSLALLSYIHSKDPAKSARWKRKKPLHRHMNAPNEPKNMLPNAVDDDR